MTTEIQSVFHELWRAKYPTLPFTSWGAKEFSQTKRLAREYGIDVVLSVVDEVVSHWGAFQASYPKLTGYPSIGAIYGYRSSFFPEALARRERRGLRRPPAGGLVPDQEHPELEVFARLDAEIAEAHRKASAGSDDVGGSLR